MFSIYGGIFFLLLSCIAFYYVIIMENKKYHARTWPFVNLLFIGLGFLALGIIILVKYA
jgi:hypothetical protein